MDPVCVLKDDQAVWEYKGGPVTEKLINETYTEECLTCDDLLEKNKDKFKWMCKIEVQLLSRLVFLLQLNIFRERNLRSR